MKKLILVLFLIQFTFVFSQNGTKNFIDQNYIEVTGSSKIEITPNEIYLSIIINENDKKGKISVEKQENIMIDRFKKIGINIKNDFKVKDYSSNYKFYFLKKTDILKSKKYQLVVHNGKELGKVYQTLEDIGISNITIEKINHSEIEKFRRSAKIKALKVAKEKATDYALAINQTLGKALYVQETNNYNSNYRNQNNMLNEVVIVGYGNPKNKMEGINNIEFEKIKIHASVLTRFELK